MILKEFKFYVSNYKISLNFNKKQNVSYQLVMSYGSISCINKKLALFGLSVSTSTNMTLLKWFPDLNNLQILVNFQLVKKINTKK